MSGRISGKVTRFYETVTSLTICSPKMFSLEIFLSGRFIGLPLDSGKTFSE